MTPTRYLLALVALFSCCQARQTPSEEQSTNSSAIGNNPTASSAAANDLFELSIIHWGDFHARFEPITNATSAPCLPHEAQDACFGGYARIVTTVRRLMNERRASNPIHLNAGDNFQGTFWYNVGRWNVTAEFLNLLPADAITIGNHEFSHDIEGLAPFLRTVRAPFVACNIDASAEPSLHGLFQPSYIIDRYAQRIGIIGVTMSTMPQIARVGRLRFIDEAVAVRAEAARLRALGVRIVVVLSHCGIDVDERIARDGGPDIDVIVGGHSHTFMYSGSDPANGERPRYAYPLVVPQNDGHRVLIVHASSFTRWVGDFMVQFDAGGRAVSWTGNPQFQDNSVQVDAQVERHLVPWRALIRAEGDRTVTVARVPFARDVCFRRECNLGNLMAAAAADAYRRMGGAEEGAWTQAAIAVINVGATRTPFATGAITVGDLMTAMPFENTYDVVELRGRHVREMLEHAVSRSWQETEFVGPLMVHVDGMRVVYDVRRAVGQRVVEVQMLCRVCAVPEFGPLDEEEWYALIVPSFMYRGGDGFEMLRAHGRNYRVGPTDTDVVQEYMQRQGALTTGLDGRIRFV